MNAKVAKRIRRIVYKDISLKIKREYVWDYKTGSVVSNKQNSKRSIYKKMKALYMHGGSFQEIESIVTT